MKAWWNFRFKSWYVFLLKARILVWIVYIGVSPAGNERGTARTDELLPGPRVCEFTRGHMSSGDKRHRTLLSSTHQSDDTLTNVIDVPASAAQEGGGAAKGHFAVGGGFHLHVAVLGVLAGQSWWVSDGGIWVFTVQRAGAVAAHGAFDVICRSRKTKTQSAQTQTIKIFTWCPNLPLKVDERGLRRGNENHCHSGEIPFLLCLTGD